MKQILKISPKWDEIERFIAKRNPEAVREFAGVSDEEIKQLRHAARSRYPHFTVTFWLQWGRNTEIFIRLEGAMHAISIRSSRLLRTRNIHVIDTLRSVLKPNRKPSFFMTYSSTSNIVTVLTLHWFNLRMTNGFMLRPCRKWGSPLPNVSSAAHSSTSNLKHVKRARALLYNLILGPI